MTKKYTEKCVQKKIPFIVVFGNKRATKHNGSIKCQVTKLQQKRVLILDALTLREKKLKWKWRKNCIKKRNGGSKRKQQLQCIQIVIVLLKAVLPLFTLLIV